MLGHDNYFTIGASVDRSKIGFQGNSELGYIFAAGRPMARDQELLLRERLEGPRGNNRFIYGGSPSLFLNRYPAQNDASAIMVQWGPYLGTPNRSPQKFFIPL